MINFRGKNDIMDVHGNSSKGYEPCRRLDFEDISGLGASVGTEMVNIDGENEMNDYVDARPMISIHEIHKRIHKELIPEVDMKFETEDDAYNFYLAYAKSVGFGVRMSKAHKDEYTGKICDRIFCCSKEGSRNTDVRDVIVKSHRPLTRCNCNAHIKISCRKTVEYPKGDYRIVRFVADHNHDCVTPSKTHLFRSHRKCLMPKRLKLTSLLVVGLLQERQWNS
ncbi:hypothetical protein BUALT_Bualt14G0068200 [Buddleja alternifolia]|uniref:FAR1 domain-containing protein n=1 Tax=Buddleja alternifolia TaxID=168488 RepID=A0AAV6WNV8_9LAMI|nr:hypothetical protein BUALT_Bualt14G0068200 [Buddleja alternifolia]